MTSSQDKLASIYTASGASRHTSHVGTGRDSVSTQPPCGASRRQQEQDSVSTAVVQYRSQQAQEKAPQTLDSVSTQPCGAPPGSHGASCPSDGNTSNTGAASGTHGLKLTTTHYRPPAADATPRTFLSGPDADYLIIWDGGAKHNQDPSRRVAYGSYRICTRTGKSITARLELGSVTNNAAEYQTLIVAVEWVLDRIKSVSKDPGQFSVVAKGDSLLVVKHLDGEWRTSSPELKPLRNRLKRLLAKFRWYRVEWQPRAESELVLGH